MNRVPSRQGKNLNNSEGHEMETRTAAQNDAGTCADSDTGLTQPRSGDVHPFSSDITALDSRLRREKDKPERVALEHDISILRAAPKSSNSKRFIGRQMAVRNGTYRKPEARWLRPQHLDAE